MALFAEFKHPEKPLIEGAIPPFNFDIPPLKRTAGRPYHRCIFAYNIFAFLCPDQLSRSL
jgi:hypothetical protein